MIGYNFKSKKKRRRVPKREEPTRPNPNIPEIKPEEWEENPTRPNPNKPEIEPDQWEEKPTRPNPYIPERPVIEPDETQEI